MSEWKLVPVDLDARQLMAMADESVDLVREGIPGAFRRLYKAAVLAAPSPPADPRDAEIERLREAARVALAYFEVKRPGYAVAEMLRQALRGDSQQGESGDE